MHNDNHRIEDEVGNRGEFLPVVTGVADHRIGQKLVRHGQEVVRIACARAHELIALLAAAAAAVHDGHRFIDDPGAVNRTCDQPRLNVRATANRAGCYQDDRLLGKVRVLGHGARAENQPRCGDRRARQSSESLMSQSFLLLW